MHLATSGVNTGKAYTWTAAHTFQDDVTFSQDAAADLVKAGMGNVSQITLGAHLDQDDVLIKRDVDGDGGTYSAAGALLVLQYDGTNLSADNTNFLENQNAAGTALSRFDASGHLIFAEIVRLKKAGNYLQIRNLADSAYLHLQCDSALIDRVRMTKLYSYITLNVYSDDDDDLTLHVLDRDSDVAAGTAKLYGSSAKSDATTNKVGGPVELYGGTGDGDAGQEDADGGTVSIYGGAAASDLANSDGGDVLLYAGDHGSSGSEGSVKILEADASTVLAEFTEGALGFFAVTPQAQQAHIVDADGQLADITTKFNTLLADLEGYGLLASA